MSEFNGKMDALKENAQDLLDDASEKLLKEEALLFEANTKIEGIAAELVTTKATVKTLTSSRKETEAIAKASRSQINILKKELKAVKVLVKPLGVTEPTVVVDVEL